MKSILFKDGFALVNSTVSSKDDCYIYVIRYVGLCLQRFGEVIFRRMWRHNGFYVGFPHQGLLSDTDGCQDTGSARHSPEVLH